jgi:hypothetical protein
LLQKLFYKISQLPFWLIIPILAFTAWLNSPGIILGDEYVYAKNSIDIVNGTFTNTGHHFDNRFGLLLPMSLFVLLLGTHYTVFFIWPLCSLVILIYILKKILNPEGQKLSLVSIALIVINTAFIRLAGDVSVDLVMTLFLSLAFFLSWHTRQQRMSSTLGGILVGFCLFFAVFTKMTAIFCFPFFGILIINDLAKKQFFQFWKMLLLSSGIAFAIYFLAYDFMTGDAFFRFRGLESSHGSGNVVPWNYRNRPWTDIFQRLTLHPVAFFLYAPGYGTLMILSVFSIFYHNLLKKSGIGRFTAIYFLIVTAAFWFGSTSLQQYNPVVLVERMLLPILPAASVLCAILFTTKRESSLSITFIKVGQISCILGIIMCLILFYLRPDKGIGLAYSIFILTLLLTQIKKTFSLSFNTKLLFCIPLFIHHFYRITFIIPELPFYTERNFLQNLEKQERKTLVLTDARTAEMYPVFFDFKANDYVKVVNWNEKVENNNFDQVILHKNGYRKILLEKRDEQSSPPTEISNFPSKLIHEKSNVRFYLLSIKK